MFSRSQSEENLYIKYENLSSPERLSTAGSPMDREDNKDGVSEMDGKRYALRWHSHQSTVVAEVGSLYRDAALVDVTLACEDQRTYQAHKLVLSACSQYFQSLFSRHPAHQHPIIFLKDVSGDECEALLTYMYRGEVSVNKDQIPRILRVGRSLQVRGLAGEETLNSRPSSPYADRGGNCPSSSPSPSTGPPTKCATPSSEPQSPNGLSAAPSQSNQQHTSHSDSGSTRHSSHGGNAPPHPSALPQDFPSYHLLPHHRPPYDPSTLLGPLGDQERKRHDDKPSPSSLVATFHPTLRVKQDLGPGSWDSGGVDLGVISPLSLPEGPRTPLLSHPIFSSFIGQDQPMPTVSQGYGMFPISDPLRRVDRLCPAGGETRIHKCHFCSRKFKRKDHLKTHVRIHTGERPYKCKVCGRGFIQSQQVKIHMKVHIREDSSGSLGSASMLSGNCGPPDTRTLSALYPDLASHYGGDSHSNDRGRRQSHSNPDGSQASPPQGSSQPDSDNEFSSEAPEGGEFESLKDPPLRLPPSSSSGFFQSSSTSSSSFLPKSGGPPTSNNNHHRTSPSSPLTTNHSGTRNSPPPLHNPMETSPTDESCGVSALKGGPSPYHIATNLKK